jgi:hypothetical protein
VTDASEGGLDVHIVITNSATSDFMWHEWAVWHQCSVGLSFESGFNHEQIFELL